MNDLLTNHRLLRLQGYIDGSWVDRATGERFSVFNPFDGKEVASVADMGRGEAVQAVEAAYFSFATWKGTPSHERGKKIRRVAELIQKNAADLAFLITLEQGKPLTEAICEVHDTVEAIRWFAEEGERIHGYTQGNLDRKTQVMTIRQPVGVVGAIIPWNFPLFIAAQKIFAAVAAGCTVVLKPAEETPLTALALADLCQEADLPAGVVNVLPCKDPRVVGEVLTTHPLISHVTFTGSSEVGKKILAQGATTVKRTTLELGGNCPAIIFDDADIEKAVQGVIDLKFYNTGQCCNTINRVFLQQSIYDDFVAAFTEKSRYLTLGNGLEAVHLGPLISRQSKQKIERLLKDAMDKGAEVFRLKERADGLFFPPTLVTQCRVDMELFSEEIFGPIVPFYSFETEDEAVAMANDTRYGLAAYFYTEDLSRVMRVSRELEAGTVGVNTTSVYSTSLPFGGWKESGLGREGGIMESLHDYCEVKAIVLEI